MAALSANRALPNIIQPTYGGGVVMDMPVGAAEEIYQGSFLSLDSGDQYIAPAAANEVFAGLSLDRKTGGSSNGDNTVRALQAAVIAHAIANVAVANIGAAVYITDDQTLTLADTTAKSMGRVINVNTTGTAIIQMKMLGETLTQAAA